MKSNLQFNILLLATPLTILAFVGSIIIILQSPFQTEVKQLSGCFVTLAFAFMQYLTSTLIDKEPDTVNTDYDPFF